MQHCVTGKASLDAGYTLDCFVFRLVRQHIMRYNATRCYFLKQMAIGDSAETIRYKTCVIDYAYWTLTVFVSYLLTYGKSQAIRK